MSKSAIFTPVFLRFLIGRGILSAIDSIMGVAFAWHLYQLTKDPFDLALVGLFQITPVFLLFPVTGWVVDHVSRSRILIFGASMQLCVLVGVAFLMQEPEFNKWILLGLISVYGVGKSFMSPALQATLPNIVEKFQLNQAVAITSTVWNLALTLGPFIAGLLIAVIDRQIYWLLVVAALVGLTSYATMPHMSPANQAGKGRRDLLGGLSFVFNNKIVLGSLSLDLFIVMLGGVVALLPIYAADVLHVGPEGLGLLRAMPAAGAVIFGLYLSHFKTEFQHTGTSLFIALTVFALSILSFALTKNIWIASISLFIYGASDMVSVVIRGAVVQCNTPDALRGRVSAANSIFIASSNQLGDFRAGSSAALLGPVNAALFGGVCALGIVAGGAVYFKQLRQLRSIESH